MAEPKPVSDDHAPKAVAESEQEYFGIKVKTYVLDDGRRIIDAEDFHKILALLDKPRIY